MTEKNIQNTVFGRVGRKMPYSAPENLMARMEGNVLNAVSGATCVRKRKTRVVSMAVRMAAAVAAIVIVAVLLTTHKSDSGEGGFAEVEQAFNQLSTADRAFLIETYQEDVFTDEQL